MKFALRIAPLTIILTDLLAGCVKHNKTLGQQDAIEVAWKALDPHTISHNRQDWEIHEASIVYGKDIVRVFTNNHTIKECPGPGIPENQPIKNSSQYWYIRVLPHPEVNRPLPSPNSATLVPIIPEPSYLEAAFLIDIYDGDIVAQNLICH